MGTPLLERAQAKKAEALAIANAAKSEERDLTDDEAARYDTLVAEASKSHADHMRFVNGAKSLDAIGADEVEVIEPDSRPNSNRKNASPGEAFVKSSAYAGLIKQFGANIPNSAAQISGVTVDGAKALITSPAELVVDEVRIVSPSHTPLTLADQFTMQQVSNGNTIQFVTGALTTNNAALVAEGAAKPESAITFSTLPVTLEKVAHWVPITTEALADFPYMRSLVDGELVYGVREVAEARVLAAIDGWTGLGTQAFDTDVITTVANAILSASLYGTPTGVLMHPADALALALTREGASGGYLAGPMISRDAGGNLYIDGVRVFRSYGVTQGFAYVGDLSQVIVHYREGVTVSTGWQNTQFIENELTILAEARLGVGIRRGPALVKADLTAA